jgi:hypothetical protein
MKQKIHLKLFSMKKLKYHKRTHSPSVLCHYWLIWMWFDPLLKGNFGAHILKYSNLMNIKPPILCAIFQKTSNAQMSSYKME